MDVKRRSSFFYSKEEEEGEEEKKKEREENEEKNEEDQEEKEDEVEEALQALADEKQQKEERYSKVAVRAKLSVEVEQKKRLGAWGRRVLVLDGATLYAYKVKGEGGSVGGWSVGGADVHVGKGSEDGRHLLVIARPPAYKLTFSFTTTYEQARMIQALSSSGATVTGLEAIMLLKNLKKRQEEEQEEERKEEERKRMTMEEGLLLQTLPYPGGGEEGGGGGGGGEIRNKEEEEQSKEEGEEGEEGEEEEMSKALENYEAFSNIFSSTKRELAKDEEEEEEEDGEGTKDVKRQRKNEEEEKEKEEGDEIDNKEENGKIEKENENKENMEGKLNENSKKEEKEGYHDETRGIAIKNDNNKENKQENISNNKESKYNEENANLITTSTTNTASKASGVGTGGPEGVGGRVNPLPKPPRARQPPEGRPTDHETISESLCELAPDGGGGEVSKANEGKEGSEGVKDVINGSEKDVVVKEGIGVKETNEGNGEIGDNDSYSRLSEDRKEEEGEKQEEKEEQEESSELCHENSEKGKDKNISNLPNTLNKEENVNKEENKEREQYKADEEKREDIKENNEEKKRENKEQDKGENKENKEKYNEIITKMRLDRSFTLDTHTSSAPSSAPSSELPSPSEEAKDTASPRTSSPSPYSPIPNAKSAKDQEISDSEEQFEKLYNELTKIENSDDNDDDVRPLNDGTAPLKDNGESSEVPLNEESSKVPLKEAEKTELQRTNSIIKRGKGVGDKNTNKKVQFDPNIQSIDLARDPSPHDLPKAKENGDVRPGVAQIKEKTGIVTRGKNESVATKARKIEENKRKTSTSPSSPVRRSPQVSSQVKTTRYGGGETVKKRDGLKGATTPLSPTKTWKKTENEEKKMKRIDEKVKKREEVKKDEDKGKKIEKREEIKIRKDGKLEERKISEGKGKKIEEEDRKVGKDEKGERETGKEEEKREDKDEKTERDVKETEKEKKEEEKETKEEEKEIKENREGKIDKEEKKDEITERKMEIKENGEKDERKVTTKTTTNTLSSSSLAEVKGVGSRSAMKRQSTVDLQAPLVISGQVEIAGSATGRLNPRRVEVRDGHLLAFISAASTPSSRLHLAGLSVTPMLGGGGGGGGAGEGASLILSRGSRCMMVLKLRSREEMMTWIHTLSDEVLRITPEEHLRGLKLYPSPEKKKEEEEEKVEEEEEKLSDDKDMNEKNISTIEEEKTGNNKEEKGETGNNATKEKDNNEDMQKEEETKDEREIDKSKVNESLRREIKGKTDEETSTNESFSLPSRSQRKQESNIENGEMERTKVNKRIMKSPHFMEHLNKFREQQKTEAETKKMGGEVERKVGREEGMRKTGDKKEIRSNKITDLIKKAEGRDKETGKEGNRGRKGSETEKEEKAIEKEDRERGEEEIRETTKTEAEPKGIKGEVERERDEEEGREKEKEGTTQEDKISLNKEDEGSPNHPPLRRLSGHGKSPLSSPLSSLEGVDEVDNYLMVNKIPEKSPTTTTAKQTTTKSHTTNKKSPPHHHHHTTTSSTNRHANCFKVNDPISIFNRSISASNASLSSEEGRKAHTKVLNRSTSDLETNKERSERLTRKGAIKVKKPGNRTSRQNSERESDVDVSESTPSARSSASSTISSRILAAKNIEIIERKERKSESDDAEDKENERSGESTNRNEREKGIGGKGRIGEGKGVDSITWSVAATREKFELLCSMSGESNKGKLTTRTPISRRRSTRMTQKRRRTQELNTTPRRQGNEKRTFLSVENELDTADDGEKSGIGETERMLRGDSEEKGYVRNPTTQKREGWPTKEAVKEARRAFEGYSTTMDKEAASGIQKEKLTAKKSPLARTRNILQENTSGDGDTKEVRSSPTISSDQSRGADVVLCWRGPYIAQESEQEVLNNISNAFLAKRRLLNKEVAMGRLQGRLHLLEEHLWGLQARLATEEQTAGGDRKGVERALESVEEEISAVTSRLATLQQEAQQAREKLAAAVATGLSLWGDKNITPRPSFRKRGTKEEEKEEDEEVQGESESEA